MSLAAEVRKFHDYAVNDCGMSRSKAAAWLINKELEERWLKGSSGPNDALREPARRAVHSALSGDQLQAIYASVVTSGLVMK